MSNSRTYYQILNISPDASLDEIRSSFRQLARQYHPDVNPHQEAQQKFQEISEAYQVLSDSVQRSLYDQQLGLHKAESSPSQTTHTYRDLYIQGIEKAFQQNYPAAIECYSEAIKLNPSFVEAYLKRGELYYKLGQDQKVLENCRQVLQFEEGCGEIYFYLGRSRYRLGYTQSALEAYHQVIALVPDYALAYYHRAVAYHDLGMDSHAAQDLQQAALYFQEQGDFSGYRLANETRRQLKPLLLHWDSLQQFSRNLWRVLVRLFLQPQGGLGEVFPHLHPRGAMVMGLIYGAIAHAAFLLGVILGWDNTLGRFSWPQLIVIGLIPFTSLVLLSALLRLIFPSQGHWGGDFLLAGATTLPVGFLALCSGFSTLLGPTLMSLLTLLSATIVIFNLYTANRQLSHLPEQVALWCVPLLLFASGWLSLTIFISLMNRG
ncbi:DnaJ domain-containing protein [Spirulina subsalsa FACHB-351]|uniref:DnaJ domain-containing protein n=1 Tax=Spirulina subsalsa FACHB-351 TaxID=234711 RepID=A0ABT3KZS9_9CYAN|nr:DnaJ domain-containing protein [Spirulina subsalsa]MCW6034726.1 DnaJ domain-containing protein [Spirulina subsalsa FACHB-351]